MDEEKLREREMKIVAHCLIEAGTCGLRVEVVFSALQVMKTNPKLSISDAMLTGLHEWVK